MNHRKEARRLRYLKATTLRMSTFVDGIQNSQEITHDKNLVGSDELTRIFVDTMRLLGDRLGPLLVQLPPSFSVEGDFVYIRWLGDRREFPSGHTHSKRDRTGDLAWWAAWIEHFLSEGRKDFAYANNHYQNHSPSTLVQLLEILNTDR